MRGFGLNKTKRSRKIVEEQEYEYSEIEILRGLVYLMEVKINGCQRKLSSGKYISEYALKNTISDFTKIKGYLQHCLNTLELANGFIKFEKEAKNG